MRFTHGCLVLSISLLANNTRGLQVAQSRKFPGTASRGEGKMAVFLPVFHPPADGLVGVGVWYNEATM